MKGREGSTVHVKGRAGGIVLAKLCLSDEGKLDGESYPDDWFTDESANLAKY